MAARGWIAGTAHAAGGSRHFKLWIPATLEESRPSPLVVVLHGCTHGAEDMAEISGMNQLAEARQFLAVYPEQSRRANLLKCWNWFDPKHQARDAGEPSILAAVVHEVTSTHNVDPERMYAVGVSAGGAMASILAATYPDIFSAVALFAGAEFKAATSVPEALSAMKQGGPDPLQQGQLAFEAMRSGLARKRRRRIPVIAFHGSADSSVNPVNLDQVIAQWGKTNALLAAENSESSFTLTEEIIDSRISSTDLEKASETFPCRKTIYAESDGSPLMERWLIEGLGHAWSGSPKPSKYGDPKGPDASAEIWRFFSAANSIPSKPPADSSKQPEQ